MTNQQNPNRQDPQNNPVDFDYYCKNCGECVKKDDILTHVCKPDSAKKDTDIQ